MAKKDKKTAHSTIELIELRQKLYKSSIWGGIGCGVVVVKLFDCQHNLPPIYYVDCFFALRRRISQSMNIASSSPANAPDESSSTSCHLPVRPATKS